MEIGGFSMKDPVEEAIQRITAEIEKMKITDEQKDRMKRSLNAIKESPRGRINLEKNEDFEKYLTIRREGIFSDSPLEFCVVSRMIDYAGGTAGRKYEFPTIYDMANIIEEYKDIVESGIVDAINYQRTEKGETKPLETSSETPKTPKEQCRENMEEAIRSLDKVPDYKKQRVLDVLQAISESGVGKVYAVLESGYSEAIGLRSDKGEFGYYQITRWFDEWSGATVGRNYREFGAKSLVEYVEKNRTTIDKELSKKQKGKHASKTNSGPERLRNLDEWQL